MRLLALALTPLRQQVAYRWLDDPFAPPRLLVDSGRTPLRDLRKTLEQTILGEPISASEYKLVTANKGELLEIQEAFPDLEVIVLPGNAFEDLLYAAEPLDFQGLCTELLKTLDVQSDAGSSGDSLATIARNTSMYVTGRSLRALAPILDSLLQATWVKHVEGSAEGDIRGIPFAVSSLADPVREGIPLSLLILSIASDPGLHRDERDLIARAERAVVIVVNTSNTAEEYSRVCGYLKQVVGDQVLPVNDSDQAVATIRDALAEMVRSKLLGWLRDHANNGDLDLRLKARVENASFLIEKFMA